MLILIPFGQSNRMLAALSVAPFQGLFPRVGLPQGFTLGYHIAPFQGSS